MISVIIHIIQVLVCMCILFICLMKKYGLFYFDLTDI